MDDDPDPTHDKVVLKPSEISEQIIHVGELQKCSLESGEESSVHQESGDNGPFLEQEAAKKTTTGKDAPDLALQTNSKAAIFKRKEQVDPSPTPDAPVSMKRKPSRRSLQWSPGQDPHHNNAQLVGEQAPLCQKSSRVQLVNEVETWINKKTGKIMNCRGQQTSASWERKILSEILHCSSEISSKSKGTSSEEDSFSTGTVSESEGHLYCLDLERNTTWKQKYGNDDSPLLIPKPKDFEEEVLWISPRTGKEMRNRAQQTSILWELKALSEILRQENFNSPLDSDTMDDTVTSSVDKEVRQDIQKPEEPKPEPVVKNEQSKYDQSQQTDSVATLKKELLDYGQQTDSVTESRNASIDLKESYHSSQILEAQQSKRGSRDSQRTTQNLLGPASHESVEKELEVPAEQIQEPVVVTDEDDENSWISKKTGKVVKNRPQQTDKSWLQYCVAKNQKVKICSSQQTDESYLQWFAANKRPSTEDLVKDDKQDQQGLRKLSSGCRDLDVPPTPPTSDMVMPPEGQDATRKTSIEGPTNQVSVTAPQWPDESESRSTMSSLSFAEEETGQQTYSIISLEDGIWLNRRTGKILISHSQQTSQTAIPTVLSVTSLRKAGSGVREEELQSPGTGKDVTNAEQGKANVDGQQAAGKESHRSSQAKLDYDTQAISAEPFEGNPQTTDEVEKLLSTRLSEAMLLSVESLDMEDEPVDSYTPVKEGSWMNLNTGMVLTSQTQQTEEDAKKFLVADDQLPGDTFQRTPETLPLCNNGVQPCAPEGMDDDPVVDNNESVLDPQTPNSGT